VGKQQYKIWGDAGKKGKEAKKKTAKQDGRMRYWLRKQKKKN